VAHGPITIEKRPKTVSALPPGNGPMRLTAVELACHRGGRDVFSGVSFTVGPGEALTVTGRNGAGKSSLLRLVAGFLRPTAGSLSLDGGDPELSIAEQAHYLGHQDAVKPSLSVGENLQFWAAFLGGGFSAGVGSGLGAGSGAGSLKVPDALAVMGLGGISALPAAYLSAGQRRRLSIARLIAVKRPLWLLDEPTSTLDAAAQDRLAEVMRSHLTDGGLILAATHAPLELAGAQELRLGDLDPKPASAVPVDGEVSS
jgi:heme exporter protein A